MTKRNRSALSLRRYTDDERPQPAQCYDCGLDYDDPGWIEAIVPSQVWEIINPTFHKGAGLLCITCISRRCVIAGLKDVPILLCGIEPLQPVLNEEDLSQ